MLPLDGLSATCRLSTGLGSTSTSCLPLPCLYSAPSFCAIPAVPPCRLVSSGCHFDQFLASPADEPESPLPVTRIATTTSAAATPPPASEPSRNPKRLRNCDGPVGCSAIAGCAPERGGSGGSSIRRGA